MTASIIVADEVVRQAIEKNEKITGYQLQLILYYLDVISLLENNKHLITDEKFKKYPCGPHLARVSELYKYSQDILTEVKPYIYLTKVNSNDETRTYHFSVNDIDVETRQFIQQYLTKLINCNIANLEEYVRADPQLIRLEEPYNDKDTIKYYQNIIKEGQNEYI